MLEKLAGRLTWEQTGSGIRVGIPARLGWVSLFLTAWLTFWLYGGSKAIQAAMKGDSQSGFIYIWLVGWAGGVIFAGSSLLWSLGGRTTFTLNQTELEIERRVFGVVWGARIFPCSQVRNLRYMPPGTRSGFWSNGNSQSLIRFEADDKTRSFASGISDIEAFALIDKMLEVYPFPKQRALEYIGRP